MILLFEKERATMVRFAMPPQVYQVPVLAAHPILQAHLQNRYIETPVADDVLLSLNEVIFHFSARIITMCI